MLVIITLFALLVLVAGFILLIRPAFILDFIEKYAGNSALYAFAIVARLVLGLLLVNYAGLTPFPLVVAIIGWIAIVAAVVFAAIGRQRFEAMLRWMLVRIRPWGRAGGVASLLFGAFLLYAFV